MRWSIVAVFLLFVACGKSAPGADGGAMDAAGLDASSSDAAGFDGSVDAGPPDAGAPLLQGNLPASISTDVDVAGVHQALQDVTIAPGATVTFLAGAAVTFAPGTRLIVHGALVVAGATGNVVTFAASGLPWGGVYVESGGTAFISFAHITAVSGGAGAGLYLGATAAPSSIYDSVIDESQPAFDVAANITAQRNVVHNASSPWNGPVTIRGGIAAFTDLVVDQGTTGVDAIVGYGGSPQLNHITVRNHHCCIHFTSSTNAAINAMDCDATDVYGFMFYGSNGATGTGSNIVAPSKADAYSANGPISLTGNYWGGGAPTFGGAQASVIDGSGYATSPIAGAGSR